MTAIQISEIKEVYEIEQRLLTAGLKHSVDFAKNP